MVNKIVCMRVLVGLVGLGLAGTGTSATPPVDEAAMQQAREQSGAPALGLMYVSTGNAPWVHVAGKRSKPADDAVRENDHWHIGSNAKAITATLVGRLAERGLIDWQDSLGDVLDEHVEGIHPDWRQVTYASLLRHCSGLPANPPKWQVLQYGGLDRVRDARADRLALMRSALRSSPESAPGSTFVYSNLGYVAVATMLEASLDRSYIELLREHVLEPLDMQQVGVGPPGLGGKAQPLGHARGLIGLAPVEPGMLADNPPVLTPAGRLHMPLADYARFLQDWLDGINGRDALLQPASYQRLMEPGCNENYASGWGLSDGALVHNGSNTMWLARVELREQDNEAAVVVSNSGDIERQIPVFRQLICQMLGCS